MSELSELLTQANTEDLSVDQVTERMRSRGHEIGRDTVWKYLTGRHPQRARRQYLEAFADVFPSVRIEQLERAAQVPAALGPWRLPDEAQALDDRERAAVELLIRSIARGKAPGTVVALPVRAAHQDELDEIVESDEAQAAYRPEVDGRQYPPGPVDDS